MSNSTENCKHPKWNKNEAKGEQEGDDCIADNQFPSSTSSPSRVHTRLSLISVQITRKHFFSSFNPCVRKRKVYWPSLQPDLPSSHKCTTMIYWNTEKRV